MIGICGGSKTTTRRSLVSLAKRGLVVNLGKSFGGSCRYQVLSTMVPPEGQMDVNSTTTGTIDGVPIVPPQDSNSPSGGTSIVPPEGQEGSPKKVHQKRKSKYAGAASNSAPIGTALSEPDSDLITWEETKSIAKNLHENGRRKSDTLYGNFFPEEIEVWAKNWHLQHISTGGYWKGSKVVNEKANLEAWLMSCAGNNSKRYPELRGATSPEKGEPPFGTERGDG
jgi:hypothetical protein